MDDLFHIIIYFSKIRKPITIVFVIWTTAPVLCAAWRTLFQVSSCCFLFLQLGPLYLLLKMFFFKDLKVLEDRNCALFIVANLVPVQSPHKWGLSNAQCVALGNKDTVYLPGESLANLMQLCDLILGGSQGIHTQQFHFWVSIQRK